MLDLYVRGNSGEETPEILLKKAKVPRLFTTLCVFHDISSLVVYDTPGYI